MPFVELFSMLFSMLVGRRRKKIERVVKALSYYQDDAGSPASVLELETAFFDAYKKKASAAVILKMANSYLGPYESFDAYSRSSLLVECDYEGERVVVKRRARNQVLNEVMAFFSGMLLLMFAVFLLLCGIYASVEVVKVLIRSGVEDFMSLDFKGVVEVCLVLLLGGGSLVLGSMMVWLSFKLLYVDRTRVAVLMADSIQDASSDTGARQ